MPRRCAKEEKIKVVHNAKRKLVIMVICICLMMFSVMQVYYLTRYTFGLEVSSRDMAVYNWVLKLVSYDETDKLIE